MLVECINIYGHSSNKNSWSIIIVFNVRCLKSAKYKFHLLTKRCKFIPNQHQFYIASLFNMCKVSKCQMYILSHQKLYIQLNH